MLILDLRRARQTFFILAGIFVLPAQASATWSVVAVDVTTGQLVIASATCLPQNVFRKIPAKGLMDIQAIIVPGVAAAVAQAAIDGTRENQNLIYAELKKGSSPQEIVGRLKADPNFERRQYGIVDMQGRYAGFSGSKNSAASLSVQGRVPGTDIYYSVQGNILASEAVVTRAAQTFKKTTGTLADRVMVAMEAGDEAGGDVRCTCETEPVPDAPCDSRNAHVAYILAADPDDPAGESFNDGDYRMYINVTDENIKPHENGNPVMTLRMRYNAWKKSKVVR
jgi:uncharacterized Ntn-hydrolase superfamily protein